MTTAVVRGRPWAARRDVPLVLAALLVLAAIAYPLASDGQRSAVTWTIVLLGATLSVAHAALSRGPWAGLAVLVLVATTSVAFEAVGLATGFPYGSYRYGGGLGPTLLGVPFLVPLAWLMMAWPSRLLGEILARPVRLRWRRATGVVAGAAVFTAWDVVLDPQMVQAGYWTWQHPHPGLPGIDSVPLTNLGGWLLAGVVMMALLEFGLGRLVARGFVTEVARIGPTAPLVVLAWMTLGGSLAQAGWLGLPGSAAWGVALAVPVLVVLGRRRRRAGATR